MSEQPLHVVYHAAGMGPDWYWKSVVSEQLALLREVGLSHVRATYVGQGVEWFVAEAERCAIALNLVRADTNTDHYETFALLEVERLAKEERTDRPIMYLHTKGVSAPHHVGKLKWRKFMEYHTVRQWQRNLTALADHDCVGVDWIDGVGHSCGHFCGNFWIATADWIRRLPDFWGYHNARDRVRFSCESWIGSNPSVRPHSLVCRNQTLWYDDFDWSRLAPWDFRCEIAHQPLGAGAPLRLGLTAGGTASSGA